tara:strand:+ start:2355 stop:3353 length:999 start_codon:yes stop_codon:yes gene_type:complete
MKKILILKNDRVGDFFNSVKGINSILNEHKDFEINIFLSNYSKDLSFLFDLKNVKVQIIDFNLNFKQKLYITKKIIFEKYQKIYILSPKNFYFYLPLISNSKFYAICVKETNKNRPSNFLIKKLHSYAVNDRTSKKIDDSIENLIEKISNEKKIQYPNILNNNPNISNLLNDNLIYFKNFIHIHYKHVLFKKNGWELNDFTDLINKISYKGYKIFLTSDYGNFEYNNFFLNQFSYIDFKNQQVDIDNNKIIYLHNIEINDLFKVISLSDQVLAPHGTMTVMASYLKRKVIDIFDVTVRLNSFREYRPSNNNYKFLILKNSSDKIKNKIINFL